MAPTNPRREKISLAPAHRDEHHDADHANGPGIKANDAIQHAGSGKNQPQGQNGRQPETNKANRLQGRWSDYFSRRRATQGFVCPGNRHSD
jgi:hypothetical protein